MAGGTLDGNGDHDDNGDHRQAVMPEEQPHGVAIAGVRSDTNADDADDDDAAEDDERDADVERDAPDGTRSHRRYEETSDGYQERFMRAALEEGVRAMRERAEVPVGCVLVHRPTQRVVGRGANRCNELRNATKHAELVSLEDAYRHLPVRRRRRRECAYRHDGNDGNGAEDGDDGDDDCCGGGSDGSDDGDDDGACEDEHSQQCDAASLHDGATPPPALTALLTETDVYVTCEPCIMCTAALITYGVGGCVFFGCRNERFGGCGTVLDVYDGSCGLPAARSPLRVSGGHRADEAVALLQRFYEMENMLAPAGKRKVKRRRESGEEEEEQEACAALMRVERQVD